MLQTDIKFLSGVGPKRAELLGKELRIETFGDLLYHFPYRYIDRSRFYKISEINSASFRKISSKFSGLISDIRSNFEIFFPGKASASMGKGSGASK